MASMPIQFNMAFTAMDVDNGKDQEWELHKEIIRQLYLVENRALSSVIEELRVNFGFDKR